MDGLWMLMQVNQNRQHVPSKREEFQLTTVVHKPIRQLCQAGVQKAATVLKFGAFKVRASEKIEVKENSNLDFCCYRLL